MTFEIELDGRNRTVSVERAGRGRYRVAVDGHAARGRCGQARRASRSRCILDGGRGTSREVQVVPTERDRARCWCASTAGRSLSPSTAGGPGAPGADADGQVAGAQTVVAPMPGRVVRVLVGPGDEVAARQAVVVVEAMKMENELRSPKAGRVKEVPVSAGTSVEAGRVLVVIE